MENNLVTKDELDFLSKKNQVINFEEELTLDKKEFVKDLYFDNISSLKSGFEFLAENGSVELIDYQLGSMSGVIDSLANDSYYAFSFSSKGRSNNHVLLIKESNFSIFDVIEGSQDDKEFAALESLMVALKRYYFGISKGLSGNVLINPLSVKRVDSLEFLEDYYEIKHFGVNSDVESFEMYLFSDIEFCELLYGLLEINEEKKVGAAMENKNNSAGLFGNSPVLESGLSQVSKPQFGSFSEIEGEIIGSDLGLLSDVPLELSVLLGRTKRSVKQVLEMNVGKIIELDTLADESLEVYCNGKLVAEGEVVVVDENFGVKITKLYDSSLKSSTR